MFRQNRIISIILCFGIAVLLKFSFPEQKFQLKTFHQPSEITAPNETKASEKINTLIAQLLQEGIRQGKLKQTINELCHANHQVGIANMTLTVLIDHLLKTKPVNLDPYTINFKKDELITGEYIFFNLEKMDYQSLCDGNGYIFPHLIKKHLEIGVFIHTFENLAYIYYPPQKTAFRCQTQRIIPQQNVIILDYP